MISKEKYVTRAHTLVPNPNDPRWGATQPIAEVMAFLGAFVVDGPVDVERQFRRHRSAAINAVRAWPKTKRVISWLEIAKNVLWGIEKMLSK